jgi:hypothetical protein
MHAATAVELPAAVAVGDFVPQVRLQPDGETLAAKQVYLAGPPSYGM